MKTLNNSLLLLFLFVFTLQSAGTDLKISKDSLVLAGDENSTAAFIITSELNWTVSSSQEWLVVNSLSGSGTSAIILTAQINSTNSLRKAEVTVTTDSITKVIKVTQHRTIAWQKVFNGDNQGGINAFAVDSTTGFFYAGTDAGLKISTDNVKSWEPLIEDLPNLGVTALSIRGNTILAGFYTGIYKSTNYGVNWNKVDNTVLQTLIRSFAVRDDHIFASTDHGIFLSTNNGDNWIEVSEGLTSKMVKPLLIKKDSIFAGTFHGVYLSTDNGSNWIPYNTGLPEEESVISLEQIDGDILAGLANSGVFRLTGGSSTWIPMDSGLPRGVVETLVLNGNNLYAGVRSSYGGGLFVSSDSGNSWQELKHGLSDRLITSFCIYENTMLAGTYDRGAFLSNNQGDDWTAVNICNTINEVYCIAVNGDHAFASVGNRGEQNLYRSDDGGNSWLFKQNGISNAIVFGDSSVYKGGKFGGVSVSTDNGETFVTKNTGLTNYQVSSLAINGSLLYAGTAGGVFLSSDQAESWSEANNGLTDLQVLSLAVKEEWIFAGTANGVYRSTDQGNNWNHVSTGLTNTEVFSLAINQNVLLAGTASGVFLSTDDGDNWAAVANGLPPNTQVLSLLTKGDSILAGTREQGIYLSVDMGNNWVAINDGLLYLTINTMALGHNTLIIGTREGGIWKRSLSDIGTHVKAKEFERPHVLTYPNPFTDFITVRSPSQMQSISVYSLDGKLLKQEHMSSQLHVMDLQHLKGGVYILMISTSEGTFSTPVLK